MSKKNQQVPAQLETENYGASRPAKRPASVKQITNDGGPIPVQPVASNIQLTPIVQPVAFVPYSTQKQPLLTYDGGWEEVEEYEEVAYENEPTQDFADTKGKGMAYASSYASKKKKASAAAIVLAILSLVMAAVLIVGKFVDVVAKYLAITSTAEGTFLSGYGLIEQLIANIQSGVILDIENLIPAAIALVALFTVLTFIACLIRVCKKGACVFAKITVFFTFTFALIALVFSLINKLEVGIGLYIVTGLSFVMTLIAYLAKGEPKNR